MSPPRAIAFACITFFCTMLGCATASPKAADIEHLKLGFVQDRALTREQAILQLGEPTGRFENDHILTWLIWSDAKGEVAPVARQQVGGTLNCQIAHFSLVLIFDRDLLVRHSLVPLK